MNVPYLPIEALETTLVDKKLRPIYKLYDPSQKCLQSILNLLNELSKNILEDKPNVEINRETQSNDLHLEKDKTKTETETTDKTKTTEKHAPLMKLYTDNDLDKLTTSNITNVETNLDELANNYKYIITNYQQRKGAKSMKDNKYIYYGKIMDILKEEQVISDEEISTLAINILLDDLDFNKTVLLVMYLLNSNYSELNEVNKKILNYYNSSFLETANGKNKALFIPNKSEFRDYTLYMIKKVEGPANITLNIAEYEDYKDFDPIIISKKIATLDMANALGILSVNKKITKELVTEFKVKYGTNKGARCDQAGKANSEKIFTLLGINDELITRLRSLNQTYFCAAQEIYFRLYDMKRQDGKRWFINLSESIINSIISV
jgi:hypothetical protein